MFGSRQFELLVGILQPVAKKANRIIVLLCFGPRSGRCLLVAVLWEVWDRVFNGFRQDILAKRKSWRAAEAQNILGNPENFIVRRAHFGREL